jgi:hypothetical protein
LARSSTSDCSLGNRSLAGYLSLRGVGPTVSERKLTTLAITSCSEPFEIGTMGKDPELPNWGGDRESKHAAVGT